VFPDEKNSFHQAASIKTYWRVVVMRIKVLGPGCARCHQVEQLVREAVAEAGVDAVIEKVTDVMAIAQYGVLGTPAVVIDEKVKSVGKIPKKEDVLEWLQE
jgi:small redox-active disulfide protein 2